MADYTRKEAKLIKVTTFEPVEVEYFTQTVVGKAISGSHVTEKYGNLAEAIEAVKEFLF